ncbi:MAG TPA: PilZ domain-containing protein [Thermoanaerobaculia bacterium]|nr:PilZ domain-containing protein [Thermoanaerobaculia bacterium]
MSNTAMPYQGDPDQDRRTFGRLKLPLTSPPARLGESNATMVDVSPAGARLRHGMPLRIGSSQELAFTLGPAAFQVDGKVLASHVILVGSDYSEAIQYESRIHFERINELQELTLRTLIQRHMG